MIREEFASCYYTKLSRCLIETGNRFDQQFEEQKKQRDARKKKTEEELAKQIKEEGGVIRADMHSVYWHLAALLRAKAKATYQATESEQRELATLRYEFDQTLAQLRKALSEVRSITGVIVSILNQLEADVAAAKSALQKAKSIDALATLCEREKMQNSATSLPKISHLLDARISELKDASVRACNFATPQSQAEAEHILQGSRRAREQMDPLANSARNLLNQLAQAAASDAGQSNGAASQLEALLDELESVTAFRDQREKLARIPGLNGQVIQIAEAANQKFKQMRTKASSWKAEDDIRKIVDQASRIVGIEFAYIETSGTISDYRATASYSTGRAKEITRPYRYESEGFAASKQAGWDRYSNCKPNNVDTSGVESQISSTEKTIESELWAADLCLRRAEQLAEPFADIEVDSADEDDEDSAWGSGQMQDDKSGSGNSAKGGDGDGWNSGGITSCVTPANLQAQVSSAVAQLQAAVSQPDRYAEQMAAVNNLVRAANHPDVCPDVKSQIRATLAALQNAHQQQLAAAQEENLTAVSQGRAEQTRRRQSWARVASGLAATLRTLQRAGNSAATHGATNSGPNTTTPNRSAGTSTSAKGAAGPNAGSPQCDAIGNQLNSEANRWQHLAMRRPSEAEAEQWCREVVSWQSNFSNLMQRAEQAGCTSLPKGMLEQTRQISRADCAN